VPQTNIYDVRHAENPTHIRTSFKDETRNKAVVKTVYTGKIRIHHGAGADGTDIDFQYPLLGFFRENNGTLTPGIIPIDQEGGQEFLGAADKKRPPQDGESGDPSNRLSGDWFERSVATKPTRPAR
jgi:hypothetical protein